MTPGRPDVTSLVAAVALAALGALLLLDDAGTIELDFAIFAPVACAVTGAILLVSGLTRGRR